MSEFETLCLLGNAAQHLSEKSDVIRKQRARIEALEAALQFIIDGYDNQDIKHVDYRVAVYRAARTALDKDAGIARIEALEAALRDNEIVRNIAALDQDAGQ